MSDLQKYRISDAHAQAVRASGFDIQNPDRRHAVDNPLMRKFGRHPPARDARAQALLDARSGKGDRMRDRILGLGLAVCLLGQSIPAIAADTFPIEPSGAPGSLVTATFILVGLVTMTFLSRRRGTSEMPVCKSALKNIHHPTARSIETPVTPEWIVDAASRMGLVRRENQDAFRVITLPNGRIALIVCDGAGGVAGGKAAAMTAVEELSAALTEGLTTRGLSWDRLAQRAFARARDAVDGNPAAGITTAIVVVLDRERVHYATLGDGDLAIVWPDGMVQHLLAPHHYLDQPSNVIAGYLGDGCNIVPRIGSIRVERESSVLAMTDGVSDLFPFDAFARKRADYAAALKEPNAELVDGFLAALEAARDPDTHAYLHNDNMTLALGYLPEVVDHD